MRKDVDNPMVGQRHMQTPLQKSCAKTVLTVPWNPGLTRVLGIVSATMVRNNQLQAIQTAINFVTQEVLGLGIVFKATAIKRLIDSFPKDS